MQLPILIDQIRAALSSSRRQLSRVYLFLMSVIWLSTCLGFGFLVYALCMLIADRKGLGEDWAGIRQVVLSRPPDSAAMKS